MFIRNAKNGCASDVKFRGKSLYYEWDYGMDILKLGEQLDKVEYIKTHLNDSSKLKDVELLLTDWDLYENGWVSARINNVHLFRYLSQIGNYGYHRPKSLKFLKDV